MNFVIFILILIPLTFFAGIVFAIWKFTHLILERRKVEHPKLLATLVCILSIGLLIFLAGFERFR